MKCPYCNNELKPYNNIYPHCCPDCRRAYNTAQAFEKRAKEKCDVTYIKQLLEGNECSYCHFIMDFSQKHIDHIIPISKGGTNSNENLCLACNHCNEQKNTMTGQEYRNFLDKHPEEFFKRNFNIVRNIMGKKTVIRKKNIKENKTYDQLMNENAFCVKNGKYQLKPGVEITQTKEIEVKETVFILDEIVNNNITF